MKSRVPALAAALLGLAPAAPVGARFAPPSSPRATYAFDRGWRLLVGDPPGAEAPGFDDAAWTEVTLPRAWNEDAAFRVAIAELPTGVAWYRKRFRLPRLTPGGRVLLELERVRQAAEVYVNGRHVGRHENGVMAAGFDLTAFVRPEPAENVVAVRTDSDWDYAEKATGTPYQWSNRNFNANYGGLTGHATLHVTGALYQTLPLYSNLGTVGPYVYARDIDVAARTATVVVETEVRSARDAPAEIALEVVMTEPDGTVAARWPGAHATVAPGGTVTLKAASRVEGLRLWSWGYGALYDVHTILRSGGRVVDAVRTRTGFRKTRFADGMVALNDRVIHLKGYAQRSTNEWPALGSAVPAWLGDFGNRLIVEGNGNLVRWMHVTPSRQDVQSCDRIGLLQALPAGDAEKDASGRQWEQRVELMRDAIVYHRNSPSVVFYEGGNEEIGEPHMRELVALRDRYDPHGGRAMGSREMLRSRAAEWGGEMLYVNKSARHPLWATEYSRDEGLRKYWDELSPPFHRDGDGPPYRGAPAPEYNRNQDSHAVEDVVRWFDFWRVRPGTGARVSAGGVNIVFSDTNTHFRGAENYRRSGEVDALRIPKDGYFAHQAMWDGWVDDLRPRIHLLGHWSYAPGVRKDVRAVSSAFAVELFLNGRPLGRARQESRFLFTVPDVPWEAGTLKAVGLDADGAPVCETAQHTAGAPASLRLRAITGPGGLRADGADVALVEFEVVDAGGRRCPTRLDTVRFALSGPAEWRGGIAQGPGNHILSKELPVEGGVNRALVRSTARAGAITIEAQADGLRPARLTLTSREAPVVDGLGGTRPGEDLPPYLERGPTPAGPSFTVTRTTVPIASVTAGTNAAAASATIDDDETTLWTSTGSVADAWIRYEFTREATPTVLSLKLDGFRRRRYPIRVTIDGQEVYRGVTPRSLGYVELPLRPFAGRTLTVALLDRALEGDAFAITELEETPSAVPGDPGSTSSGVLGIVEAECFEARAP
jgi:beta-galactosidase